MRALAAVTQKDSGHVRNIDLEILGLLSERERLVRRAGAFKTSVDAVRAEERQRNVIDNAGRRADELGGSSRYVRRIYTALVEAFVALELNQFESQSEHDLADGPSTLADVRAGIDGIDEQLVPLMVQRGRVAAPAPAAEADLMAGERDASAGSAPSPSVVQAVFAAIQQREL